MLHAVTYAFLDSLNVLLIGIVVALGIMLPERSRYRHVVGVLIVGDWLGVFLLALSTMFIFDQLGDVVRKAVSSPIFGWLLIFVGILSIVMTARGGDSQAMVAKFLPPLHTPSFRTLIMGLFIGLAQSVTSVPFFAGIAVLSAGDFSWMTRYLGMIVYASIALSLPTLSALMMVSIRSRPTSRAAVLFQAMRERPRLASQIAGYTVGIALILMGSFHL
ncbi:hypothetical protein N7326_04640 [Corynebacterium sp. ES2794-CONJ1]|uniref:hypothetical protein n=1 Tax=unclassified Corynebacterium TaxID=2624378 RepID=UPI00216B1D73|nr:MULTISPECIES: hypothetical protein [unclassified Corynebacterium]MCS4531764.1 hypothetical protein [Corynebacterium sp. ES2730-CONJ]MCU9519160.1 hypothetical protein [Corynebacterium sp. ES2794-CONJ1]